MTVHALYPLAVTDRLQTYRNAAVSMGSDSSEYQWLQASADTVREIVRQINA